MKLRWWKTKAEKKQELREKIWKIQKERYEEFNNKHQEVWGIGSGGAPYLNTVFLKLNEFAVMTRNSKMSSEFIEAKAEFVRAAHHLQEVMCNLMIRGLE